MTATDDEPDPQHHDPPGYAAETDNPADFADPEGTEAEPEPGDLDEQIPDPQGADADALPEQEGESDG